MINPVYYNLPAVIFLVLPTVDAHFGFVFYAACGAVVLSCCAWGGVAYSFSQRASQGAEQVRARSGCSCCSCCLC